MDWICSLDEERRYIYKILIKNFLEIEQVAFQDSEGRITFI
jgi:hypothetical protein